MTKKSAAKTAARNLQKSNPGQSYQSALNEVAQQKPAGNVAKDATKVTSEKRGLSEPTGEKP